MDKYDFKSDFEKKVLLNDKVGTNVKEAQANLS